MGPCNIMGWTSTWGRENLGEGRWLLGPARGVNRFTCKKKRILSDKQKKRK